ncbi:MAG: head maturation protease, ClpP-related [Minisyncoccota bacterium]
MICEAPRGRAGRIEFHAAGDEAEILLYEFIGYDWWSDSGTTAEDFAQQLAEIRGVKRLTVRINSGGGDVWDGMSIYNQLSQFKAHTTVIIDGIAASIAALIAMAGDTVQAAENSQLMIHDAWTIMEGNEQQLREVADILVKIDQQCAETFARRSSRTAAEFRKLQDKETYLTAAEARELGLVDEVLGTRKTSQNAQRGGARGWDRQRMARQLSLC